MQFTHFAGILGADGNAELRSDEGVVDEVGDVLEGLTIVLTGRNQVAVKSERERLAVSDIRRDGGTNTFDRVSTVLN